MTEETAEDKNSTREDEVTAFRKYFSVCLKHYLWDEVTAEGDTFDFIHETLRNSKTRLVFKGSDESTLFSTTPFRLACCSGNVQLLDLFLQNNFQIAESTSENYKAFNIGSFVMLSQGQETLRFFQGTTLPCLLGAVHCDKTESVRWLLDNGIDRKLSTSEGSTAMHFVNSMDMMHLLVENNFAPGVANDQGKTLLHILCFSLVDVPKAYDVNKEQVSLIKFILDNGATVNATDKYGMLPIHLACRANAPATKLEVVKLILNVHCDTNPQNKFKETPLMLACADLTTNETLIKYLVENDANPSIEDYQGLTPFHKAANAGARMLLQLFLRCDIETSFPGPQCPMITVCTYRRRLQPVICLAKERLDALVKANHSLGAKIKNVVNKLQASDQNNLSNILNALTKCEDTVFSIANKSNETRVIISHKGFNILMIKMLIDLIPDEPVTLGSELRTCAIRAVLFGAIEVADFLHSHRDCPKELSAEILELVATLRWRDFGSAVHCLFKAMDIRCADSEHVTAKNNVHVPEYLDRPECQNAKELQQLVTRGDEHELRMELLTAQTRIVGNSYTLLLTLINDMCKFYMAEGKTEVVLSFCKRKMSLVKNSPMSQKRKNDLLTKEIAETKSLLDKTYPNDFTSSFFESAC